MADKPKKKFMQPAPKAKAEGKAAPTAAFPGAAKAFGASDNKARRKRVYNHPASQRAMKDY